MVPARVVQEQMLSKGVSRAVRKLGRKIVRLRYSVREDWSGDPAIYFRVVIPDAAAKEERLSDTTEHISSVVTDEVRPYENWGLIPYFSFRSKSEQEEIQQEVNEPEWA
jgi:hypothetical protein